MSVDKSRFAFFSSRRRHTRYWRDWSSDVCSSDLLLGELDAHGLPRGAQALSGVAGLDHPDARGQVRRPAPEALDQRSEERRVGKECRSRWSPYHSTNIHLYSCLKSLTTLSPLLPN